MSDKKSNEKNVAATINAGKETPSITLWGVSASPYVRKVMVALAEKNIVYQQKEILPKILLQATGQSIPDDFDQASPLGKIPALQIDNFSIADSAVIAAYLDRKFSTGNQLYPNNAEEYARTLWFEHYADNILTETGYKKIFYECVIKPKILNQDPNHELVERTKKNELPPILDYLTKSVSKYQWISGNHFSIADIALSTQLLALKMAGINLEQEGWGHLNQYLEKVISRNSFKKILSKF